MLVRSFHRKIKSAMHSDINIINNEKLVKIANTTSLLNNENAMAISAVTIIALLGTLLEFNCFQKSEKII